MSYEMRIYRRMYFAKIKYIFGWSQEMKKVAQFRNKCVAMRITQKKGMHVIHSNIHTYHTHIPSPTSDPVSLSLNRCHLQLGQLAQKWCVDAYVLLMKRKHCLPSKRTHIDEEWESLAPSRVQINTYIYTYMYTYIHIYIYVHM